MPEVDTSLTIVGIISIVALLSPPITALIENLFKLLGKCIDHRHNIYSDEYKYKRKLFEEFLDCTGRVTYDKTINIEQLLHSYYVLIPYVPREKLPFFREYYDIIANEGTTNDPQLAILLHDEIIPCIKKELRRHRPLHD